MAGEYLDPSRWPLWMQSGCHESNVSTKQTFDTGGGHARANVPGLLDGLKSAGATLLTGFNNLQTNYQ